MGDDLQRSARGKPSSGRSMYEFIVDESEVGSPKGSSKQDRFNMPPQARPQKLMIRLFVIGLSILCLFVFGAIVFTNSAQNGDSRSATAAAHTGSSYESGFNMKQNWGAYSPYFNTGKLFPGVSEPALSGINTLPQQCEFSQVHVLHRHADRFPAGGTAEKMQAAAARLKSMTKPPDKSLAWITDWQYLLKTELLTSTGVASQFMSGARFWGTHGRLLYKAANQAAWSADLNVFPNGTARPKPVLRATTQYRITESARAWAAGFFGTFGHPSSGVNPEDQYKLVLQTEAQGMNNSLASGFGCPNSLKKNADTGADRKWKWVDIYLKDAAIRLQKLLPGYENFGPRDALAMQDFCAFETAAYGSSPFCELFTETEWRGFEYHMDLNFYGECGWGSPVGPASGLAWLEELLARLKGQLIEVSHNGVNTTLTNSQDNFPLEQPFYADFTHDGTIISVLSALQFDWTKTALPASKIKMPRQFILSRLTPFAARFYVEVMKCDPTPMVRMRLNDRVIDPGDLKYCSRDANGLCSLKNFIKSVEWAIQSIDFEDICYGDHEWPEWKGD